MLVPPTPTGVLVCLPTRHQSCLPHKLLVASWPSSAHSASSSVLSRLLDIPVFFESVDNELGGNRAPRLQYPSAEHVDGQSPYFPSWGRFVIAPSHPLRVQPRHVVFERLVDQDVQWLQHQGKATWDHTNVSAHLLHSAPDTPKMAVETVHDDATTSSDGRSRAPVAAHALGQH